MTLIDGKELWERMRKVLAFYGPDYISASKDMGISLTAFRCFLHGERTPQLKTLSKIIAYVERKELEISKIRNI